MNSVNAYTAGLIDGEGSITLAKYGRFRFPLVSVSSTTLGFLEFLKTQHGGYISKKSRKAKEHHKTGYAWSVQRDKALVVLERVALYLLEPEKKRRADLILSRYKGVTPRNGRYSAEMESAKFEFEKEFFSTNTHVNTVL